MQKPHQNTRSTDKPKRITICKCTAYKFPHKEGGGKCNYGDDSYKHVCLSCHQPCEVGAVDFGIGPYEFWGRKGIDKDVQIVSDCCESDFTGEY